MPPTLVLNSKYSQPNATKRKCSVQHVTLLRCLHHGEDFVPLLPYAHSLPRPRMESDNDSEGQAASPRTEGTSEIHYAPSVSWYH